MIQLRTVLSILALLLGVSATSLLAQDATPEATPESTAEAIEDSLPEGVELLVAELPLIGAYEHALELEAGDVLSVIANDPTGAADPLVLLFDAGGAVVAENNDHDTEITPLELSAAVLEDVEIEEDGEYVLRVENAYFEAAEIEVYILLNADIELGDLFADVEAQPTPTPSVQLQERPEIRTTGPCTASVDFIAARLREAPTASAPQVASLLPGARLVINGRVRGADGYTWYRLENYLWVRADAVLAAGACGSVPTF